MTDNNLNTNSLLVWHYGAIPNQLARKIKNWAEKEISVIAIEVLGVPSATGHAAVLEPAPENAAQMTKFVIKDLATGTAKTVDGPLASC